MVQGKIPLQMDFQTLQKVAENQFCKKAVIQFSVTITTIILTITKIVLIIRITIITIIIIVIITITIIVTTIIITLAW